MRGRMWGLALYVFVLGFILNLLGIVSHVVVSSFAKRWFGTPFPRSLTTEWYSYAWKEFGLAQVLGVTIFVSLTVVVLALLMGFPAAYILARRNFRWKPVLLLLYFLPLLIPQMTYGIPLATTMFRYGIGGSVTGVILAKLDGSAKGGMVFAIQEDLGLPVRYVGLGESSTDLALFDRERFVDGLLAVEGAPPGPLAG